MLEIYNEEVFDLLLDNTTSTTNIKYQEPLQVVE